MLFSDPYEFVGLGGVRPGSRDLVAWPHDRYVLS